MSKNFYGRKLLTGLDKLELSQLALDGELEKLENKLQDYKEIHLGRSANGWKFLFQYNKGKYYTNKLEFLNFIETIEIKDEYSTPYTAGEFWHYTQDDLITDKSRVRADDKVFIIDGLEFLDAEFS